MSLEHISQWSSSDKTPMLQVRYLKLMRCLIWSCVEKVSIVWAYIKILATRCHKETFLSILVYIFLSVSFHFSANYKKTRPVLPPGKRNEHKNFSNWKVFLNECNLKGATTLSVTTFGIMTLGIAKVARMTLRLVTFSITTPTIMTLSSWMTVNNNTQFYAVYHYTERRL